ncbi:type I-F CRISPR-associated endoribonuclease Cas6/Csy4 [Taylorella equigenitalis]|uniref:type I-F CRISPR-associated endoribonuclease Cas6/Csy4 n=2 Tax=Taylorella equigenitalis TaxID=29575 RepID=UPI0023AF63D8|nr:type I-F CRISPR-associated endoribonuclease Cas6/Csy4 [Taylorella equigenitalis]WEE00618.1 type I-F CRISPR-associated endoribonuclease Cas6/Csy4 [Taylorella equigenitalis]WEE02095.1 type I-F CRISPR-associated endoribonuclease Cas6/Csy4 [Taylorella equigenitalis]WFD78631.1 type I-F CRISPR-associated endoribonuclease Cas6/Csy4 [Taylorella equigenitalis]WFD80109.1 type I-F CRISPR-associated endoribonuclease Cas6/Csy4 [Taylorella equigenitalis]WFD83065.1 type I-F CRISPR-associated endoribonucle
MDYYIELTLIDQNEVPLNNIMNHVFSSIHNQIVNLQNSNINYLFPIGISFPNYVYEKVEGTKSANKFHSTLGNKIRLFSKSDEDLEKLNLKTKLRNLRDYIHITNVKSVPKNIQGYANFFRHHVKSNPFTVAKRLCHRKNKGNFNLDELKDINKLALQIKIEHTNLPYVCLISQSSKHRFRLFIDRELVPLYAEGKFNSYGLAVKSNLVYGTNTMGTVPLF